MRKWIKKYLPSPAKIREMPGFRFLGDALFDRNLWHMNRKSMRSAAFYGLFLAVQPIPIQVVAAAAVSILMRCNLPLCFALVWISNPFTSPAIFFFCYLVGCWLLGLDPVIINTEWSLDFLLDNLARIGWPLLAGCLLVGIVLGILGFLVMDLAWRWHIWQRLQAFRRRRFARLKKVLRLTTSTDSDSSRKS